MERINFNQTGGFPLTTDILNFMQNAYNIFNALGNVAGDCAILSGCVQIGNTIGDGVVFINGEVLPFKGGILSENVIINEDITQKIFEDGESKDVLLKRYATFGNGTNVIKWNAFGRILTIRDIDNRVFGNVPESDEGDVPLLERIEKIERRLLKTIPIGLVAIWDRPADQIPEGWVEHTELSGYTPVGYKVDDADFKKLGKTLGAKTHQLLESELPEHSHNTFHIGWGNGWGASQGRFAVSGINHGGNDNYHITGTNNEPTGYLTSKIGKNKAHNNIQPSRIVRFIRFVGFND